MFPLFSITDSYYLIVTYIMAGIVGLCVGSFLNVVIYRVPEGMSLAHPASHCPNCDYQLKWYDNIPILSYCMLGGKCRNCRQPISPRYTVVEAANMILWVLCVWLFHEDAVTMGLSMLICSVSLCVFFIDLEHMIIPDRFQVILGVVGVIAVFADHGYPWYSHLIGAVAGGGLFWLVGFFVSRKVGKEALGGGDIKFAFVSGLILGWEKFLLMMLISSISASIVMLIRNRGDRQKETPFAPFLTTGLVISTLVGKLFLDFYIEILLPV